MMEVAWLKDGCGLNEENEHEDASSALLSRVGLEDDDVIERRFDSFVREHYHNLVQYLRRRTKGEQDAEDAAQESLAKLLRYRTSTPASEWKLLLYRIATNVAHDQSRCQLTHAAKDHIALEGRDIAAPDLTPEDRAAHDQQLALITKAILALPPKCQQVYLLKRVHDMSRAQIAEHCNISVKMVEKHLANALMLIRRNVFMETGETSPFPLQRARKSQ
ncbi:Sigma-70 region 2 [Dyella sp. OK004]|nr:Sigma-70 region 2 [Dyella sp. OK004]